MYWCSYCVRMVTDNNGNIYRDLYIRNYWSSHYDPDLYPTYPHHQGPCPCSENVELQLMRHILNQRETGLIFEFDQIDSSEFCRDNFRVYIHPCYKEVNINQPNWQCVRCEGEQCCRYKYRVCFMRWCHEENCRWMVRGINTIEYVPVNECYDHDCYSLCNRFLLNWWDPEYPDIIIPE